MINSTFKTLESIFNRKTCQVETESHGEVLTVEKQDFMNLMETTFKQQIVLETLCNKIKRISRSICSTAGIQAPKHILTDRVERAIETLEFIERSFIASHSKEQQCNTTTFFSIDN